ncbi:hypothetical protein FJY90_04735 [Candidatus Gottesmanbacteria bacterium]|nr:hypothetical protein [Candidatus Gottesmanbacteria bacterium]
MAETKKPSALDNQPDLNEVLYSWKSPSHPFKKRDRIFFQTVAAITFLLVVIVFFLHEFMLIGVILSIAFVVYAISSVPPVEVEHKITPLGFENAGRLFRWIELTAFWFEERWGYKTLVMQTRLPFPSQVRIVLEKGSKDKVKDIVGKYLLYLEKPPKTWVDSLSDWLGKKIPLEASG